MVVRSLNVLIKQKILQSKIQEELGGTYEVKERPLLENLVKIAGVSEYEHHKDNNELIVNIINQNEINPQLSA